MTARVKALEALDELVAGVLHVAGDAELLLRRAEVRLLKEASQRVAVETAALKLTSGPARSALDGILTALQRILEKAEADPNGFTQGEFALMMALHQAVPLLNEPCPSCSFERFKNDGRAS